MSSNYSYFRELVFGQPKDSGDNAADFLFADTQGTCMIDVEAGCPSLDGTRRGRHLGAPGPENLSSPLIGNTYMPAALVAPCVHSSAPPNRVRDFTMVPNGAFGTLSVRRKLTNSTGANVTRLRFRVSLLTTFPEPTPSGPTNADLRVITSSLSVEPNPCGGGTLTIQGLRLEEAAPPNDQPSGGGYNSTLSADTVSLITPLPPTDNPATVGVIENEINVNLRLGVQATGRYRFYVAIEVLP